MLHNNCLFINTECETEKPLDLHNIKLFKMKKLFLFVVIVTLRISLVFGQCTSQVLHFNGSIPVDGVNVTVSSSGNVDSNSIYCINTFPYFVGYNYSTGSGNGIYNFNFSPAVNAITLNFSGISNMGTDAEIVVLKVNGQHYAIPTVGDSNTCDPLAVLTANGDIGGCTYCTVSGWNGTTIAGPITSLSILDSAIAGIGNGAIFSLFICNSASGIVDYKMKDQLNIYPNPANNQFIIEDPNLANSEISLTNVLGQKINIAPMIQSNKAIINVSELPKGFYTISLLDGENVHTKKIVLQ